MEVLIDKWETMRALQAINPVAKLMDGDPVIRMSAVEHVLENLPEALDINVGNMDITTHDSIPAKSGRNDEDRTTDDCISRQQAIDAICEHGTDLERRGITVLAVANHKQATVDLLENLPSAQPEPRTAYWTKDIVGSVVCSNCGGIREDNRIGHTQWCNCCGCFMRGEEND